MSMIDLSLSGLSKPGTKLVEKISDAVGILYEPTRIRKKAKAQADADRTALISKLELEGIETRALERVLRRETRRQENIENITIQAAKNLSETDNVTDIEEDWIETFFKECEDINDEQMQTLWGRILSEEAKSKGSFSRRTLKLLSSLSKEEAKLITFFGQFVWQASSLTPIIIQDETGVPQGIKFEELSILDSLGVIQQGLGYNLTFSKNNGHIFYYGIPIAVEFKNEDPKSWNLPIGPALLTPIGIELMKICGSTANLNYLNQLINKINHEESQIKLTILPI